MSDIREQSGGGIAAPARKGQEPYTCLILEDDRSCREMLETVILKNGGTPVGCGDLATARKALEERYFDFYFLDQELPDGTGTQFFYELRKAGLDPVAIMITGSPDLPNAVELTRNGLFDYLTKPMDGRQLTACLQHACKHRQLPEPAMEFRDFVAGSPAMQEVRRSVVHAAEYAEATVLLTGETGVGKDVTARIIHKLTFPGKASAELVALNCANLPGDMFEAELFGAEKGAYTGSVKVRPGLAETANGGTLFLDEIAEIPIKEQAKLLQFLETGEFRRLGGSQAIQFTGRIIAATNKDLRHEVAEGRFREDLLYRIDVFAIEVPPLRERKEDLAALCDLLLGKLADKYEREKPILKPEDFNILLDYDFPGNVRELRNLLERSLLKTFRDAKWLQLDPAWLRKIQPRHNATPASAYGSPDDDSTALESQEYALIKKVLEQEKGAIRPAARKLGISHQALLRRLEKWPELRPAG